MTMNVALWAVQVPLALLFLLTGTMLLVTPREKLALGAAWAGTFAPDLVKGVGLLEVLGAAGLVVPLATGIWPWLTPLAAVGLGVLMVGAITTHLRFREYPNALAPLAVLLLAAFVAYGRVSVVPAF